MVRNILVEYFLSGDDVHDDVIPSLVLRSFIVTSTIIRDNTFNKKFSMFELNIAEELNMTDVTVWKNTAGQLFHVGHLQVLHIETLRIEFNIFHSDVLHLTNTKEISFINLYVKNNTAKSMISATESNIISFKTLSIESNLFEWSILSILRTNETYLVDMIIQNNTVRYFIDAMNVKLIQIRRVILESNLLRKGSVNLRNTTKINMTNTSARYNIAVNFINAKNLNVLKVESVTIQQNKFIGNIVTLESSVEISMVKINVENNKGNYFISANKNRFLYMKDVNIYSNRFAYDVIYTMVSDQIFVYHVTAMQNSFQCFMRIVQCSSTIKINSLNASNNNASGAVKVIHIKGIVLKKTVSISLKHLIIIVKADFRENGYALKITVECNIVSLTTDNVNIMYSTIKNSIMFVPLYAIFLKADSYYHFKNNFLLQSDCARNYNPIVRIFDVSLFHMQSRCVSCKNGQYNIEGGNITLNHTSIKDIIRKHIIKPYKTEDKCKACPPGGDCTSQIKSRDNFYGYIVTTNNTKQALFIQCPNQYCCSNEGKRCVTYNTCNMNRKGRLCGRCIDGYHTSFFTNECINNSLCTTFNQVVFWVIYILVIMFMGLLLSITKEIIIHTKRIFLVFRQCLKRIFKKPTKKQLNILSIGAIDMPRSIYYTGQSLMVTLINSRSYQRSQETQTIKNDVKEEYSFSAIFNILISFYQLNALIKIDLRKIFPASFLGADAFFNLDLNFKTSLSNCPTSSLSVIFREFMKSYLQTVFMLTSAIFFIVLIWIKWQCYNDQLNKV